ncbi:MAG: peptidoglycan-associated lipoprotein Pal [Betaproteobacteria bacterium]
MRNIASLAIIVIATAACSTTQQKQVDTSGPATNVAAVNSPSVVPTSRPAAAPTAPAVGTPWKDPNNILSQRSVYFPYDNSSVGTDYQAPLQAQGKFLVQNSNIKVRVEGNCDERGSREYNMALGQRRANEVKKVLAVYGVNDGRAETISFGEDKPSSVGHDEASWAKNRRADIKYPGE